MWLIPGHGTSSDDCTFKVVGSTKSRRWRASATMIIEFPSGVKYMLYGSSIGTVVPGLPVTGSMGVRLPPAPVPLPLLFTHSFVRSHDGTTCCGVGPVANVSITLNAVGSI